MFISTLAAAVLLAASSPVAGAAPATPEGAVAAAPAAGAAKADKDRQICKSEPLAGSRVPKKVCATKAEWEARRQDDREQLEKMQRASTPHIGN